MSTNFQQILLAEIQMLIEPLAVAAQSPLRREQLFRELGWDLDAITGFPVGQLEAILTQFVAVYELVVNLIEHPPEDLGNLQDALKTVKDAVDAAQRLGTIMDDDPSLVRPPHFDELGQDLISLLFSKHLGYHHPIAYMLGVLLTIVQPREASDLPDAVVDATSGAVIRYPIGPPAFRFGRIGDLLVNPLATLRDEYLGPNGLATAADAKTKAETLFSRLGALLTMLGAHHLFGHDLGMGTDLGTAGNDLASTMLTFFVPLNENGSLSGPGAGATLTLSSADRGNLGLVVTPFGTLQLSETLGPWQFALKLTAGVDAFAVGPSGVVIIGTAGTERVDCEISVTKIPSVAKKAFLVGSTAGTRLEVGQFAITSQVSLSANEQDCGFLIEVGTAAFVVSPSEGDGFLNKVLPEQPIIIPFDLGIGWSTTKGLYFTGGAGLEVNIPVHKTLLDILTIDAVHLGLYAAGAQSPKPAGVDLSVAVTAKLKLGPFNASAERLGLAAAITFPADNKGNLGVANLALGFKPPSGMGMALNAPGVSGGGSLNVNHEKGEYSGSLHISIKDVITLKAFGILTVSKPGQPANFSLFILVTAEFPSIQLGFGFTLNGVGGLLGVNRTMVIEAMQAGIKTNAVDSILFPENPAGNAPAILNNLRNFFPAAEGRFVFGFMVKIGWSTPTLITIKAGVIIELPAPFRLVVIGQLRITLPVPDKPLIDLKMDILGYVDMARSELGIDATIHDSRILTFPVSGDMLLRIRWGANPLFVLSLGGFHPRFVPPPGLPALDRLAISLAEGDNPRIRLEAYLAVTSNTVQFGARLDIYAEKEIWGVGYFRVSGYLGFDALFQFHPFYFIVTIEGYATLSRDYKRMMEIRVYLELEGPNPWHAWGYASFHFLVDVYISFNITIGKKDPEPPPPIANPRELLLAALADPQNWSAQLPQGNNAPVQFRDLGNTTDVLVHPMGSATVQQRVLPLGHRLAKFGEAQPTEAGPFSITSIKAGTSELLRANGEIKDYFAAAQFFTLSNDEKIARPSFEQYLCGAMASPGGFDASGDGIEFGAYLPVDVEYETAVINKAEPVILTLQERRYQPPVEVIAQIALRGAAGLALIRHSGSIQFAGPARPVTVSDPAYKVTDRQTMQTVGGTTSYSTYIDARRELEIKKGANPDAQIVGAHEG